jgi:hypothetical protein
MSTTSTLLGRSRTVASRPVAAPRPRLQPGGQGREGHRGEGGASCRSPRSRLGLHGHEPRGPAGARKAAASPSTSEPVIIVRKKIKFQKEPKWSAETREECDDETPDPSPAHHSCDAPRAGPTPARGRSVPGRHSPGVPSRRVRIRILYVRLRAVQQHVLQEQPDLRMLGWYVLVQMTHRQCDGLRGAGSPTLDKECLPTLTRRARNRDGV